MALKENGFVHVDYVGKDEEGTVFDTTLESVAKEAGSYDQRMSYEPLAVCIGQGHLLPALEKSMIGKEPNTTFTITLQPEEAFGKKRSDMIKLMPMKLFKKEKINPFPGLEVTVDGMRGVVKSVSGNRVIVNFNHVLAGKTLTYELMLRDEVTEAKDQVELISGMLLRFTPKVDVEGKKATITLPIELPENVATTVTEKIVELTSVEEVAFAQMQKEASKA